MTEFGPVIKADWAGFPGDLTNHSVIIVQKIGYFFKQFGPEATTLINVSASLKRNLDSWPATNCVIDIIDVHVHT